METKGDNIYVNIKELPQLDQVQPGDLLIVETDTGTSVIDVNNFILPPENTTFYGEINDLANSVIVLSGYFQDVTDAFLNVATDLNFSLTQTISNVTEQISAFPVKYNDNLIKGSITFDGTSTTETEGVNCRAIRSSHGVYTVVFDQNINAVSVTSNSDTVRLDAVGTNSCVFTTLSSSFLRTLNDNSFGMTSLNSLSAGRGIMPTTSINAYEPADASLISVIGT